MTGLRVLETPDDAPTGTQHIVGLLLAAGNSSRFGEANKLRATIDGEAVVTRSAHALRAAQVDDVIAVVGYEAERVRDVLPRDVSVVERGEGRSTLSDSVAAGVTAARRSDPDAVVIALGDMPWVDPASVDALIVAYEADSGSALAAAYGGERGNPVLFDARHFERLTSISGGVGGRAVLRDVPDGALVETNDPGVLKDVDRPGDLDDAD